MTRARSSAQNAILINKNMTYVSKSAVFVAISPTIQISAQNKCDYLSIGYYREPSNLWCDFPAGKIYNFEKVVTFRQPNSREIAWTLENSRI